MFLYKVEITNLKFETINCSCIEATFFELLELDCCKIKIMVYMNQGQYIKCLKNSCRIMYVMKM